MKQWWDDFQHDHWRPVGGLKMVLLIFAICLLFVALDKVTQWIWR